jgi:hypothetical protein
MRKSRYTDQQIALALQQAELGPLNFELRSRGLFLGGTMPRFCSEGLELPK